MIRKVRLRTGWSLTSSIWHLSKIKHPLPQQPVVWRKKCSFKSRSKFCPPIFCLCICCEKTSILSNYNYLQKRLPPTFALTISVPEYSPRVKNFGNFLSMSAIKVICFPLFLRNAVFWMASISPTARPIWEEMAQKMNNIKDLAKPQTGAPKKYSSSTFFFLIYSTQ